MNERDNRMLMEFKRRLPQELHRYVRKLIVYGSRARGDSTEDSDLDVVALVENKTSEVEKKLEDVAYEVMWEFDFNPIISLKVFSELRFQDAIDKGFAFYRHVVKEGIPV